MNVVGSYNLGKLYTASTSKMGRRAAAFKSHESMSGSSFTSNRTDFHSKLEENTSKSLNVFYGFNRKRIYVKFKRLDSEKYPEFSMFNNATIAMKEILGKRDSINLMTKLWLL